MTWQEAQTEHGDELINWFGAEERAEALLADAEHIAVTCGMAAVAS